MSRLFTRERCQFKRAIGYTGKGSRLEVMTSRVLPIERVGIVRAMSSASSSPLPPRSYGDQRTDGARALASRLTTRTEHDTPAPRCDRD
jgi:hypothetical protein